MRKPPSQFQSWIEFYDYLVKNHQDLLREKTIMFSYYPPEYGNLVQIIKTYRLDTIKKNCWMEIQDDRLTFQQTMQTLYAIECQAQPYEGKSCVANKLLQKLKINDIS